MAYNFDRTPNRRISHILNKWTMFPKDVFPMWIADMDFAAPPPIRQALHKYVEHGDLGYQLPSRALYDAIAVRMQKLYNWKISADWIVTISGVNVGYNVAARTFCTSSRGYLIQPPVYNEFHETRRKVDVPQLEAPLMLIKEGNRIHYEIDFDAFEREIRNVNLFLFCNPHNPIGKIYSESELQQIADICIRNNVLIVSDEIHSELLLDQNTFRPLASLRPEIAERTITLISASKAFNIPGLFCAFAIIPNEELRKRYQESAYKMGIHANSAGLMASRIAYLGKCDRWLTELRSYLARNRDFVLDYVAKYMPGIRITVPQATYLAWFDCTDLNLQPSAYDFFLQRAKVALSNGAAFGRGSEQFVRLNFGTSRRLLKQGLERMRRSLR